MRRLIIYLQRLLNLQNGESGAIVVQHVALAGGPDIDSVGTVISIIFRMFSHSPVCLTITVHVSTDNLN